MSLIRKFLRFILKRKMRSSSLKDSRNIIHQAILYLIYRKKSKLLTRNINIKNSFDGKRCFIFFTGTSVTDFDFDLIKGESGRCIPWFATKVTIISILSAKRNKISLTGLGQASASTHIFIFILY